GVGVGAVVIESQGRVPVLAIIEVQVVIGRLHPRRWSEVAPAVLHGIAESWAQADAVAGGALKTYQVLVRGPDRAKGVEVHAVFTYQEAPVEIPVEIGVFGAIVQLQPAVSQPMTAVQTQLRQTLIGRDRGNRGQFVGMNGRLELPAVTTIGDGATLVDVGIAARVQGTVEVLEEERIADVEIFDLGGPTALQTAEVFPAVQPAVVIELAVIQEGGGELTLMVWLH